MSAQAPTIVGCKSAEGTQATSAACARLSRHLNAGTGAL